MTLNFGEYPSEERESTLSQILAPNVPQKYCLSEKACALILKRAERRGKTLPNILKDALMNVAGFDGCKNTANNDQESIVYDTKQITCKINRSNPNPGEACHTLHTDTRSCVVSINEGRYFIRKLMPNECCRLQGFPDWWTDGIKGSDAARYDMWGNGISLPCAADVIGRLAKELKSDASMREMQEGKELLKEQPEVIQCKFCKYWENETERNKQPSWLPCMAVKTREDFYCADGERTD